MVTTTPDNFYRVILEQQCFGFYILVVILLIPSPPGFPNITGIPACVPYACTWNSHLSPLCKIKWARRLDDSWLRLFLFTVINVLEFLFFLLSWLQCFDCWENVNTAFVQDPCCCTREVKQKQQLHKNFMQKDQRASLLQRTALLTAP